MVNVTYESDWKNNRCNLTARGSNKWTSTNRPVRTPSHSWLWWCPDATQPDHHFPPSGESVPSVSPCLLSINVFTWPGPAHSSCASLLLLSQVRRSHRLSFHLRKFRELYIPYSESLIYQRTERIRQNYFPIKYLDQKNWPKGGKIFFPLLHGPRACAKN